MKQQNKDQAEASIPQPFPETTVSQKTFLSQYLKIYQEKLARFIPYQQKFFSKQFFRTLKFNNQIFYTAHNSKNIQIEIERQSLNRRAIRYNMKWNKFQAFIKIINAREPNYHHGGFLCSGGFSSIYSGEFNNKKIAIKCIPIYSDKSRFKAIKQFFIQKICSAYQIGPSLVMLNSYPILMFSQCIEFVMEQCEPITEQTFKPEQLYESLALMHKLKIVHRDIKPDNLMYSRIHNRLVFIDFGLSTFLEDDIGSKTMTSFVGNIENCSRDMMKAYIEEKQVAVDLYYNDLYALQNSLLSIQQDIQRNKNVEFLNQIKFNNEFYFFYLYEMLVIFLHSFGQFKFTKKLWNFIKYKRGESNQLQYKLDKQFLFSDHYQQTSLINILEQMPLTPQIQTFIENNISQSHSDLVEYNRFKVLADMSKDSIFDKESLRNIETYNYFTSVHEEIIKYCHKPDQPISVETILSQQLTQKLQYFEYLSFYLEVISYTNNKHKTDVTIRQKAATIYKIVWMASQKVEHLSGRKLVESTILHGLNNCLETKEDNSKEKREVIMEILIKIVDFIFILDLGSVNQIIKWIEQIYKHWSMLDYIQHYLKLRILFLVQINYLRKNPQNGKSRKQFIDSIQQKALTWKPQVKQQWRDEEHSDYINSFGEQMHFLEIYRVKNPQSLIKQGYSNYIELFHKLRSLNSDKKIYVFLPRLFSTAFDFQQRYYICQQIINIYSNNYQDQDLLNELNFQFYQKIMQIKLKNKIKISDLKYINGYFEEVHVSDFYQFKDTITDIIRMCPFELIKKSKQYSIILQEGGLLSKWFQYLKRKCRDDASKSLISDPQKHRCPTYSLFEKLPSTCALFPEDRYQQILSIVNIFKPELLPTCKKCQNNYLASQMYIKLDVSFLRIAMGNFIRSEDTTKFEDFIKIYPEYVQLYKQYFKIMEENKMFDKVNQRLLGNFLFTMGKQCVKMPQLEQIAHGAQNFIKVFIYTLNDISIFFMRPQSLFLTFKNLIQDVKQFTKLCFKLCLQIDNNNYSRKICMQVIKQFQGFVYHHVKTDEKPHLFYSFQSYKDINTPYIILLYSQLMCGCSDIKLKRKIMKEITKSINRIHYFYRKIVGLRLHQMSYMLSKEKGKRCEIHCSNQMLKYAISANESVPSHRKFKYKNQFYKKLYSKIAVFDKFGDAFSRSFIKFRRK